jgi:hypothetical protein
MRSITPASILRIRHALLPFVAGLLTFAIVWIGQSPPGMLVDFDYLWAGGRAVWQGVDPYLAIQEHVSAGRLKTPYYYPATAAVLLAPFGLLSRHMAVSLFTAVGMALLCSSITGYRRWMLLSPPAIQSVLFGQWSPWLTAAIGLPWLGFVWAAKPNIGLALFGGWPSRLPVYGALTVLVISFLLFPSWPTDWYEALRGAPHYDPPLLRAGGFILLLAWSRWRTAEGRLLGFMAVIPHTTTFYELLPLLLIPQTKKRFAWYMVSVWIAALCVRFGPGSAALPEVETLRAAAILDGVWPYIFGLVYLPALYLVLVTNLKEPAPIPNPGS